MKRRWFIGSISAGIAAALAKARVAPDPRAGHIERAGSWMEDELLTLTPERSPFDEGAVDVYVSDLGVHDLPRPWDELTPAEKQRLRTTWWREHLDNRVKS